MKSIKDTTYAQIAQGFHEEPSMNVLTLLIWALALGLVGYGISDIFEERTWQKQRKKFLERLDSYKAKANDAKQVAESKKQETLLSVEDLRQSLVKTSLTTSAFLYSLLLIWIMLASFLIADLTRFQYANSAITYYKQISAIAAPYMNDSEKLKVGSQFAQIKTKEDYVAVIQSLQNVAKQNGQSVPDFSIW